MPEPGELTRALRRRLNDDDPSIRAQAAMLLGAIGVPSRALVMRLLLEVRDASPDMRRAAIAALLGMSRRVAQDADAPRAPRPLDPQERLTAGKPLARDRGNLAALDDVVLRQLSDPRLCETLLAKLTSLAWRRYHIPIYEAEDVAQTALATYCEVHHRYADRENHHGILFGIFRKKCLEHIDRSVRDYRRFRHCCASADAPRVNPRLDPEGGGSTLPPLESLIRDEDVDLIHEALDQLQPEASEMLRLLIVDGMSRQDLLEHYGINPNTLDWRLHTYRKEFREILKRKGVLGVPSRNQSHLVPSWRNESDPRLGHPGPVHHLFRGGPAALPGITGALTDVGFLDATAIRALRETIEDEDCGVRNTARRLVHELMLYIFSRCLQGTDTGFNEQARELWRRVGDRDWAARLIQLGICRQDEERTTGSAPMPSLLRQPKPLPRWKDWMRQSVEIPGWMIPARWPGHANEDSAKLFWNMELRLAFLEKLGSDALGRALGARCVDHRNDYWLVGLDFVDRDRRLFLSMRNPSTREWHLEGVHPLCRTVQDALNFRRYGPAWLSETQSDWDPCVLT